MSFGDQMKHKADEVNLQAKAKDFGDALTEMVKAAVDAVAGYAQTNREKIDGALDKTERAIEDKTGGKHADTLAKVRSQLDRGIDKIAEQGSKPAANPTAPAVPDDQHSAFDEETPA